MLLPPKESSEPIEVMSTHPLTENRIKALQANQLTNAETDRWRDIKTRYLMIPYVKLMKLKNLISNDLFYFSIAVYVLVLILHTWGSLSGFSRGLAKGIDIAKDWCDMRIQNLLHSSPV